MDRDVERESGGRDRDREIEIGVDTGKESER